VYFTAAETDCDTQALALAYLETLMASYPRVGVFRSFTNGAIDDDAAFLELLARAGRSQDAERAWGSTRETYVASEEDAMNAIVQRFTEYAEDFDAVLVTGLLDGDPVLPGSLDRAGRAAAKQGKFWEFHDAVYAAADPKGHPTYTEDSLVDFAKKAGVADLSKFRTDMTAAETVKAVSESTDHVHSIGIQGTPFMIVGETYINGYQDADYMTSVVKSQAAKAKQAKGAQGATGAASTTSPAAPASAH